MAAERDTKRWLDAGVFVLSGDRQTSGEALDRVSGSHSDGAASDHPGRGINRLVALQLATTVGKSGTCRSQARAPQRT
jgi:hypothetical protein